jgi:pimeloyl-ACP methyl ester carboxylesterase
MKTSTRDLDPGTACDVLTGAPNRPGSPDGPARGSRHGVRWPRLLAMLVATWLACGAWPARAQDARLDDARQIIANARKIVTPQGVDRLQKVRIGGIDQWVSIRGADRRNPVLLLIHGGPGYVSIPMSWWFAQGWDEYFTVVQWDQRAAGKTFLLGDPAAVASTLSLERMVGDAEEMADWARKEFGKRKIFVVGHSFGSFVGLRVAERHPDWLYAYVGVGQVADSLESERRGWRFALDAARHAGNVEAVHELEGIAGYGAAGHPIVIEQLMTQRKWVAAYGGVMAYRKDNDAESDLSKLSPDYSDDEIRHIWDGNKLSRDTLLSGMLALDLTRTRKLSVPLILFEGRHDINVNSDVAAAWFDTVKAPDKRLVWFEHSAHMPMTEEPGKFLLSLVRYVRPLAEREGDAAP